MAEDEESVPTTQLPEAIPQTIPELYFWMRTRMEFSTSDIWKELAAIREELRQLQQELQDVEQRLSEETRHRYVDLRQRIERLQSTMNSMEKRFEWQDSEIVNLKRGLRELEQKVDPPLAA